LWIERVRPEKPKGEFYCELKKTFTIFFIFKKIFHSTLTRLLEILQPKANLGCWVNVAGKEGGDILVE
jgi:hypothetical protein